MKKNRLLLLIIFLLCIGVSKVKAEYKCFYNEKYYLTDGDGQESAVVTGTDYTDCNGKTIDVANTYIELTYNNSNAIFKFYDDTNKRSFSNICLKEDIDNIRYGINADSGNQLDDSDFANGCPSTLDRLRMSDAENGDTTTRSLLYDIFKDGKTPDYYSQMYKTSTDNVEMWAGMGTGTSACYNKSNTAESLQNANKCAKVGIQNLSGSVSPTNNVVCEYANPESIASEGSKLIAQVSLQFSPSDGKYISGTGYNEFSNDTTTTPSFSLAKNGGKYVCPSAVYDCSESHDGMNLTDSACQDGKKYSLIRSIHVKTNEQDITGCAMYEGVGKYISGAYTLIRYLIPTLIVMLSTADFVGVVFSGEQDKMEKAKYKFMMRLIIGVVALLIPFLFELILRLAGVIGSGDSLADIACNLFG